MTRLSLLLIASALLVMRQEPAVPPPLLPQLAALAETPAPPPPEWECVHVLVTTETLYHPPTGRWFIPTSTVTSYRRGAELVSGLPPVGAYWPTGAMVTRENQERVLDIQYRLHATVSEWLLGRPPKWWPDPVVR
jgi:hypothetical protein